MTIKLILTGDNAIIDTGDESPYIVYNDETEDFHLEEEFNNLDFSERINLYEYDEIFTLIKQIDRLFLIVVQDKELVCEFEGHSIYRVKMLKAFNLSGKLSTTLHAFKFVEKCFIKLCTENNLYYSPTRDLTKNAQYSATFPNCKVPLKEFTWNFVQLENTVPDFIRERLKSFICGSVSLVEHAQHSIYILARRSVFNAGPRLLHRSVQPNGRSANFTELETVVISRTNAENYALNSFIQLRGCVPTKWIQSPRFLNKPLLKCSNFPKRIYHSKEQIKLNEQTLETFKQHFLELQEKYGKVTIMNLMSISPNNSECNLTKEYEHFHKQSNLNVRYFSLDFNTVLPLHGYHWNVIEEIKFQGSTLNELVQKQGCFVVEQDKVNNCKKELSVQKGAFRVNCVDSTDRTLVMNYMVGKAFIKSAVVNNEPSAWDEEIDLKVRQIWANAGNSLSMQYTRTLSHMAFLILYPGHRTLLKLYSVFVATKRMYYDCFTAGYREDHLDVALNRIKIKKNNAETYRNHTGNDIWGLFGRLVAVLAIAILFICSVSKLYDFPKWFRGMLIVLAVLFLVNVIITKKQKRFINLPSFDRGIGRI
eukprot:GAHX01001357.1.p1 GENE.GAHX01001357.1~~GAHX01001357.1.p1  ORF type:complete len:592 (-),score=109.26 GAHX01001357.1:38-1813(-)